MSKTITLFRVQSKDTDCDFDTHALPHRHFTNLRDAKEFAAEVSAEDKVDVPVEKTVYIAGDTRDRLARLLNRSLSVCSVRVVYTVRFEGEEE